MADISAIELHSTLMRIATCGSSLHHDALASGCGTESTEFWEVNHYLLLRQIMRVRSWACHCFSMLSKNIATFVEVALTRAVTALSQQ